MLMACGEKGIVETTEDNNSSASTSISIEETNSSSSVMISTEASSNETVSTETGTVEIEKNNADINDNGVITRDNFPIFDGSTSLRPLGLAIASRMLGESRTEVDDLMSFHKTDEAYYYLYNGRADILIAAEGCQKVMDVLNDSKFEYEIEPIAMEGLVFVVNASNPIDSLSQEQIKLIYEGKITNWSEVGGEDLKITAFQRNEESGSQVMMRKCVMEGRTFMDAPEELMPATMGGLIEGVAAYDNSASALGYTVYYYADSMKMADGLKIIKVDGIEPCNDTIGSGKYPFTNPYYCLIAKKASKDSTARKIYEWLGSSEGQKLVAEEGYVPAFSYENVSNTGNNGSDSALTVRAEKYVKLKDGYIGEYVPGTSKGAIYPYMISAREVRSEEWGEKESITRYGLVDETGTIVSDYGYRSVKDFGDYYRCDDETGGGVYILKNGKLSLRYYDRYSTYKTAFYIYGDYAYYFWWFFKDSVQHVYAYKYDINGNLISERELKFPEGTIQSEIPYQFYETTANKICIEDFDGRFLVFLTNKETKSDNLTGGTESTIIYHVMDLETDKIVWQNEDHIWNMTACGNYTFIIKWGETYETDSYEVIGCQGQSISEQFKECYYVGYDSYLVEKQDDSIGIYKLKNGRLTCIKTFNADEYFYNDGYVGIKANNGSWTYYDANGNPANADVTAMYDDAFKNGYAEVNKYNNSLEKEVYEHDYINAKKLVKDAVLNNTGCLNYYGQASQYDINNPSQLKEYSLYSYAAGKKIAHTKPCGNVGAFGIPYNNKAMIDNELIDIDTGNIIFSYNPFCWDNLD